MATSIITDHKYRPLACWCELPERWRTEFDYLTEEWDQTIPRFVKYKNNWYDVRDCMLLQEGHGLHTLGFEAYHGDSYFSAIIFKFKRARYDFEDEVMVALALS